MRSSSVSGRRLADTRAEKMSAASVNCFASVNTGRAVGRAGATVVDRSLRTGKKAGTDARRASRALVHAVSDLVNAAIDQVLLGDQRVASAAEARELLKRDAQSEALTGDIQRVVVLGARSPLFSLPLLGESARFSASTRRRDARSFRPSPLGARPPFFRFRAGARRPPHRCQFVATPTRALPDQKSKARVCRPFTNGASRTRTGDLLGAIQALSQLSYSPERPTV